MIYGNIGDLEKFSFLEEPVRKCLAYAAQRDLAACEKGRYEIEGKELFTLIFEYATSGEEERIWEAHRKYLDIHLMLRGRERIDISPVRKMQVGDYVEADDFLPMEGEKGCSVVLEPGDFVVCYPEDAHRTSIAVDGSQTVKKAVMKVLI